MIHPWDGGWGGRRRRRNGTAHAARVGLTDALNANGRDPSADGTGPGWTPGAMWANARVTWAGFQRVLSLVWEANPGLTIALAVLNLLQGGLPALRVWVSKLLIDAVVAALSSGSGLSALPEVGVLVALQFGVGAVSNVLSTLANICQQLLQDRVANRIQLLVMRHANQLDLVFFERPQFYDLIQQVQRDVGFRPTFM